MSKKAYLKFKNGESLTRREAVGAHCYECNGYSVELSQDCLGVNCALYPWSPWGKSHGLRIVKRSNSNLKSKSRRLLP